MSENIVKTTKTVINQITQISDSYTPNTKTDIITADADYDQRIGGISVSTSNASDMTLDVWFYDGTTTSQIARITIPDGSGTNGTDLSVNLLTYINKMFPEIDGNCNQFANIKKTAKIQISLTAAPGAGKYLWVNLQGAKYD